MEETAHTPLDLVQLAKQAIINGDKALAKQLASSVLDSDSDNVDAMLIMAGVSDPQHSLNYLNRVLEIDPTNRVAHEGLRWASQRLRKASSAAWTPETSASVLPIHQAPTDTKRSSRAKSKVFSAILPWLLAFLAIAAYGLWSVGLLDFDQNSAARTNTLALFDRILHPKAAITESPTKTDVPTAAVLLPLVSSPSETQTATVTDLPTPTATFTATRTNSPTPTSTHTPTPTKTSTKTPIPPTATPTLTTPTQAYDPTSGLPIIQITPLVFLTGVPDEEDNSGQDVEDPIEYAAEPELPVSPEPLGAKWIDVNLSEQMVYAYEGDTIVASFLVSTGMANTPTVTGHYYVYVKIPYARMTGPGYDLWDVPYTMYFYKGYGIHGTYWHSNFGTPMSHGCVNMETGDAGWLYDWAFVGIPVYVHY